MEKIAAVAALAALAAMAGVLRRSCLFKIHGSSPVIRDPCNTIFNLYFLAEG